VETELNAAADNPTLTPDGRVIANASNFHGQVVADALEHLGNAVTSLAVVSEHRIDRLLDADRNEGLPSFLIHPQAGPSSGLMIAQYTAASLVAELRTRSVPASIQSIPTCAGTEDHVSMSALAARRAAWCVETTAQVVAIELLTATQALDLAAARLPPALEPVYRSVRNAVPVMIEDRPLGEDIDAIAALVRSGQIRPAP
jgi:histidine ammonia-lyase